METDIRITQFWCNHETNIVCNHIKDEEKWIYNWAVYFADVTMTEEALPSYNFQRKYYRSIFNQCKTCLCLTQIEEIVEFVKCIQSRIENKNTGHW